MSKVSESLCVGPEFSLATTLKAAESVGRHVVMCVSERNKMIAINADRMFAGVSCASLRDLVDRMKEIGLVHKNLRFDTNYGDPVTNTAHYDDMSRKFRYGDELVGEFDSWVFLIGSSAELEAFLDYLSYDGWWALAGDADGFQKELKNLEKEDSDHSVYVGVA